MKQKDINSHKTIDYENKLSSSGSCLLVEVPSLQVYLVCCDCQHMRGQPLCSPLPSPLSVLTHKNKYVFTCYLVSDFLLTSCLDKPFLRCYCQEVDILNQRREKTGSPTQSQWKWQIFYEFTWRCRQKSRTVLHFTSQCFAINNQYDSYAAHYCCLGIGTYDGDDKGEGWPQKVADVNQPKEAHHMADLAQTKYLADSLFPPCGFPSPSCRTICLCVLFVRLGLFYYSNWITHVVFYSHRTSVVMMTVLKIKWN